MNAKVLARRRVQGARRIAMHAWHMAEAMYTDATATPDAWERGYDAGMKQMLRVVLSEYVNACLDEQYNLASVK